MLLIANCFSSYAQSDTLQKDTLTGNFITANIASLLTITRFNADQFGVSYIRNMKNNLEMEVAVNYLNYKIGDSRTRYKMPNDTTMIKSYEYLSAPKIFLIQAGINFCNIRKKASSNFGLHFYTGHFNLKGGLYETYYKVNPTIGFNSNDESGYYGIEKKYASSIDAFIYGFCLKFGFNISITESFLFRFSCEPYLGWLHKEFNLTRINNYQLTADPLDYNYRNFMTGLFGNISLCLKL